MSRRRDIEFLRVVATFLVVWYHSPSEWPEVAYSGLIFFVVASTYFCALEASRPEYVVLRRVKRLLVIWAIWYLIYCVLLLQHPMEKSSAYSLSEILLVGPSIHLWYLPFLAMILLVSRKLETISSRPFLLVTAGFIFVAAMAFSDFWRPVSIGLGAPWAQYAHALPAIIVGVLFVGMKTRGLYARIALVFTALMSTIPAWSAVEVGVTYFCGVLLAAPIMLGWQNIALLDKISHASKYMLGIYLVHPLVTKLVRRITEFDGIFLAAAVFLASLAIVASCYKRMPRLAQLAM